MGRLPTRTLDRGIVQLQDNHRAAIRMLALGASNKDVARELGLSESMVSQIKASPLARNEIDRLQASLNADVERVQERIAAVQGEAVEKVYELMYGATREETQLRAAERLLDMGGNSKIQKIESHVTSTVLGRAEIEELKQRALATLGKAVATINISAKEVEESDEDPM